LITDLKSHTIEAIQPKDAWRVCDFVIANADRLKRYFPKTLAANLTPELATVFVSKKIKQFEAKEEFLFTLKEKEARTIIGLLYVKEIDWLTKKDELAYCIGYQYENKGIISKTVQYIYNWAFTVMNLQTLEIITHRTNLSSVSVAKKCGFTWVKTLEKEHTPPGEIALDMELYELNYER